MNRMLENYINGNLTDAKKRAKRFKREKLILFLLDLGWTRNKADLTVAYLHGKGSFQLACDAT